MEGQNLLDYDYPLLESPANLVINLDTPAACGDASSVTNEPLPSFNTFNQTVSDIACWYKLPALSEISSTPAIDTPETCSAKQFSEPESFTGEKLSDRSFDMDNILGIERHCYSPRHSTPAKDLCNTSPHQTSETENLLQSNVTVNYGQYPTFTMNSLLKATNQNEAIAHPTVYKRQEDKPPYTYVAMIIVAILNSEEKGLTLAGIRDKLTEMFPFFSGEYTGWKSSIRHALSNSKCFYKIQKRDNQDTLTVYVWKVNTKFVKSYTFNRQSKGPKYESYKFTLQEELGLPPFEYPSTDDSLGRDIKLPPKPCFHSDSVSLAGSVSEDFLNARNDSVPTPMSVISDIDCAPSSVSDNKPSLKRKRNEDITSIQQTAPASKRQTTYNNYPHYGYQQYPQSAYHPTYYESGYYNSTPLSVGDQWSRDYNQYVYPQQYSAQTMNVNAYSNEILAMRNLWWSYYNGMVPSSSHLPQNTYSSDQYPSTPINMTKCDEKQSDCCDQKDM